MLSPVHAAASKALGVVYASRGDYERARTRLLERLWTATFAEACLYYGRSLDLLDHFVSATLYAAR
jgi:hypothetical protein